MEISMEQLEGFKKKLEKAERERNILEGKVESAYEELKKFKVNSIEEATKKLKALGVEADKAAKALDELIANFEEAYPKLFEGE